MAGTQTTAIVNKLLTDLSNKKKPEGYISEQILPLVKVVQTTGLVGSYGTSHLRIVTSRTTGKNKYARVDTRSISTDTYSIDTHGLTDLITEQDYANVELPFDAESDTTEELTTLLFLEKEKGLADTLTDTNVLTQNTTLAGNSQYSDFSNSDPLGDFATARNTVYESVGVPPDTAIMSWPVWNTLRYHPHLVRNLGYADQRPGGLTTDEIARALDVKRVLVGTAVYDSAAEGQTASIGPVWNKDIVFSVCPLTAERRQVSLGYRFQQFGAPRRVFKNKVENPPNAREIIVDDHYDQHLAEVGAAYLIKNAVA